MVPKPGDPNLKFTQDHLHQELVVHQKDQLLIQKVMVIIIIILITTGDVHQDHLHLEERIYIHLRPQLLRLLRDEYNQKGQESGMFTRQTPKDLDPHHLRPHQNLSGELTAMLPLDPLIAFRLIRHTDINPVRLVIFRFRYL